MKKGIVFFCCLFVALTTASIGTSFAEGLPVDWPATFNADGTVKDLGGGIDAIFLEDNISAGLATDMTAFDAANGTVINGSVDSAHDLGNGYVLASKDALGNLVLSAAVERLNSDLDTYVDFEFNQGVVGVTAGDPWPLNGLRSVNDIVVRFTFAAGDLASVNFGVWNGDGFVTQSSSAPSQTGCYVVSSAIDFCNGAPVAGLPLANKEVWDSNYNVVQVPDTDGFVEVNINVGTLVGANVEYSSVVIRTPQDIALGSFQAMGYWSALGKALATQ